MKKFYNRGSGNPYGLKMTKAERKLGRFMRAPDHQEAEIGDPEETQETSEDEDNSGQNKQSVPNLLGDDQEETNEEDSLENEKKSIGDAISAAISGVDYSKIITKEAFTKAIETEDFGELNNAIGKAVQEAELRAVNHTVKILNTFGKQIANMIDDKVNSAQKDTKHSSLLEKQIPLASHPVHGPTVRSAFKRALTISKGNEQQAVETVKLFLGDLITAGTEKTEKQTQQNDFSWDKFMKG